MRRPTLTAMVLLLAWALAAAGCAGQDVDKGKAAPAARGSTAAPALPTSEAPPAAEPAGASPWHDAVHIVGTIGGGLAVLAFAGGLIVFFGFEVRGKRWNDPLRRRLRALHIALGASGATLALAHHIGRLVQAREIEFELFPPFLCGYGFALLLISGILRVKTPKALRKVWRVFPWLHRVGFVVALFYMFRHVRYQWLQFAGGGPH